MFSIKSGRDSSQTDFRSEIEDLAPILNFLCDELWKRDQILAGKLSAADLRHRHFAYS